MDLTRRGMIAGDGPPAIASLYQGLAHDRVSLNNAVTRHGVQAHWSRKANTEILISGLFRSPWL